MKNELMPVLQMDDIEALEAAAAHLEENGFKALVRSFSEMAEEDTDEWMTPENGGYLLYIEASEYEDAMTLLGDFFGYVPDED